MGVSVFNESCLVPTNSRELFRYQSVQHARPAKRVSSLALQAIQSPKAEHRLHRHVCNLAFF
jgi:hypothetical protein